MEDREFGKVTLGAALAESTQRLQDSLTLFRIQMATVTHELEQARGEGDESVETLTRILNDNR